MQPVFRFAPSPNGYLHIGHAYSALLNYKLAREAGGRFLLRIEDIDATRCRPEFIEAIEEDLGWLGLEWEKPVLRQSDHFQRYRAVLAHMQGRGLLYPCFCSRTGLGEAVRSRRAGSLAPWPCDPDGAPLYPGACRELPRVRIAEEHALKKPHALRLDMQAALAAAKEGPISWDEAGRGEVIARPEKWGDIILGRKEIMTSYHLAVVLDDALQGVTNVVRGQDLFEATAIHRLLQHLLGLSQPRYFHHALLKDSSGEKLAKSRHSVPLRQLRQAGMSPGQVRRQLGFS